MAAIALNPDLPASYQVPGVYAYLARAGAAPPATNRRVLLLGYKTSAGAALAGSIVRVISEDDVVQAAGKGSDLHRMWRSYVAQSANTGAEIWLGVLNAPSGAAQTRTITILQAPSGAALGTGGTGAAAAGFLSVWISGYRYDVQIANGDTFDTVAANLAAAIQANQDQLPCTASVAGATVTLTARHAALTSADLPIIVSFSNTAMQLAASPGTITFATAAAAGGTATLGVATQAATATIANTDTANAIGAALVAAINSANAFPVRAAQTAPSAVVTLFFVDERVWNFAYTSITTATTTTMTPAWGTEASGLPSAASPSLSTVIGNINAQLPFKLWVTNLTGAGSVVAATGQTRTGSTSDLTVLGTLSQNIETMANGLNCKGQVLVLADTRSLTVAGAVPAGTSPALTASPRTYVGWCPASPQQAVESAARIAALVMSRIDYPPFNYAGSVLTTDYRTPYLAPHNAVRPSDAEVNAAMLSYFLAPLRTNDAGQVSVVSGRTTAKPSASLAGDYVFWGTILADDYVRDDLRASLPATIAGKSLKNFSPPRTQFTTTADAVRTAVAARMAFYDSIDLYDGGSGLEEGLFAQVNVAVPSRIDVQMPKRFPLPAEQISVVTTLAA
ncbi:MAG: hypothetical protein U1A78_32240 [Polyangia bacterium]